VVLVQIYLNISSSSRLC